MPANHLSSERISARLCRHPLVALLGATSVGVSADRWAAISPAMWLAAATLALAAWCWLAAHGQWQPAAWSVLVCAVALAGGWHHDRWRLFAETEIARYASTHGGPVLLRAMALEPPRQSPAASVNPLDFTRVGPRAKLNVRLLAIHQADRWKTVSGRGELIVQGQVEAISRGDRLHIAGHLQRVRRPQNPGEPDFAASRRNQRQLVVVHCRHPDGVRVVQAGSPWHPMRTITGLRSWAMRQLDRHLPARQSRLASALLLGARERLDQEQIDHFFVSGTLHLLAISGLHLGILASVPWMLLRLDHLPQRSVLLAVAGLAIFYAVLTGNRPPVVRAAILIVIVSLSRELGRPARSWNSLAAAAVISLALRPGSLFDTGTQLSFLAVATIIGWWPLHLPRQPIDPLARLIVQSRPAPIRWCLTSCRYVWQAFCLTSVVWLVSAPLVAYRFHIVAPLGLLLNLILWLPVSLALLSGWCVIMAAPICSPLADAFSVICETCLMAVETATAATANLPWGHQFRPGPHLWWLWGFYLALVALRFAPSVTNRRWAAKWLVAWLTIGLWTSCEFQRAACHDWPRALAVSFVAVGHGTSVLIELPDGRNILYDAGRRGSARSAVLPISSLIWSRGINHLDAIILSHADLDHFNAINQLLDRFTVGSILVSRAMFQQPALTTDSLRAAIERHQVPLGVIHESDRLQVGPHLQVAFLHPPPVCTVDNDNANSIVMEIVSGKYRLLLPGDLEDFGLDELLAELPRDCDVIMAPHHGSRGSRPTEFLAWSTPEWVVISGGYGADRDTDCQAYQRPTNQTLHTAHDGAVRITIDRQGLHVTQHRKRSE